MPYITQGDDQKKTWRLLSIAIVFALLAGIGTMAYLKILEHRLKEQLTPEEKRMVRVVVASRDLSVGSKVDTSTMSIRSVPAEYVNSDVISPDQFNSVEGAILNKSLVHGKMLSSDYIDLNIPKDFSGTVQIGHRAVTIQVGEINSVAGLIRPGNFIDLYTRLQGGAVADLPTGTDTGEIILPVLEDVLVLATDQRSARPNEDEFNKLGSVNDRQSYDTLTLEVTPKEAALIAIAESRGSLVATLRNANDTGGVNFSMVGIQDLVSHSRKLLNQAVTKQQNRALSGVHVDSSGRLVTQNGTVITDPNVQLNKDGLLVTSDGTVLSGRDLIVGQDGKVRTRDGKIVDTKSLVAGKDGTLIDKNGIVIGSNGYKSVKGGFLVDKNGRVITHDGQVLSGVTVGKDGKVRTAGGRVITADGITVGKDGQVYARSKSGSALKLDRNGSPITDDGKPAKVSDLVSIDPNGRVGRVGRVRTPEGKLLAGVRLGKDGQLISATGKKMSTDDVLLASQGFHSGQNGTVVNSSGKAYAAKDLATVGKDGKIRTRDGKVIDGAYSDSQGVLRKKDGSLLSAQDVVKEAAISVANMGKDVALTGVTGKHDPDFANSVGQGVLGQTGRPISNQVEYIIGGSSDGVATTFMIQIEEEAVIKK